MSFKEVTMYRVECDHEGCPRSAQDESDYAGWSDQSEAEEEAIEADWFCGNGVHYCYDHRPCCPDCGTEMLALAVWDFSHGFVSCSCGHTVEPSIHRTEGVTP